jgi:type II secretory pathway pseudopilin PulG
MRFKVQDSRFQTKPLPSQGEQGYMLLGLIVAIAIILIGLSVAAMEAARSIRRDRELETVRRANQYVRAIRLYYKKLGHYPASLEQLEKTNNVRYLRKRYVDPLTGDDQWRLIPVGKNQTTVKGFFGEPLSGLATTGLGAAAGMQSASIGGPGQAGNMQNGANPSGTGGTNGNNGAQGTGTTGSGTDAGNPLAQAGFGSGGGAPTGPFMGVGTNAKGTSILEPNQQTTYETWEFLYDPRLELLKQKAAMNAGIGSAGTGALGTPTDNGSGSSNSPNGFGSSNTPNGFGSTTTPTGSNSGSSGTSNPQP